jgi:hypothetical protein
MFDPHSSAADAVSSDAKIIGPRYSGATRSIPFISLALALAYATACSSDDNGAAPDSRGTTEEAPRPYPSEDAGEEPVEGPDGRSGGTPDAGTTGGKPGGDAGKDGSTGGGSGSGGGSSGGSGGSAGSAPAPVTVEDPKALEAALTPGLAVSGVAVFQTVKVSLVEGGAKATTRLPVVAKRAGVIRVYVTPASGFTARRVKAVLQLSSVTGGTTTLSALRNVTTASSDASDASCFDFAFSAAQLTTDTQFRIALTSPELPQVAAPASSTARYPQDGRSGPVGAVAAGKLNLVLVPVLYGADGTNRAPDTSAAQVQAYTTNMRDIYPVTDVNISVHSPITWTSAIGANGGGWGEVLNRIVALRGNERAASDVYYYGVFSPAQSFPAYCQRGCVAGLSGLINNPADSAGRASVGLGFTGQNSAETMAHEVGHAHGRPHAPCGGVQGADSAFPYPQGGVGVPGYRLSTNKFLPVSNKDFMSYCNPTWISDYNYEKLFRRGNSVNSASIFTPEGPNAGAAYHVGLVASDGTIQVGAPVYLETPPSGQPHTFTALLASGRKTQASAVFYAYDHIPGGMVFLPDSANIVGGRMVLPAESAHAD